jgi:hypothetical protein
MARGRSARSTTRPASGGSAAAPHKTLWSTPGGELHVVANYCARRHACRPITRAGALEGGWSMAKKKAAKKKKK